jgi:hypothetical protein
MLSTCCCHFGGFFGRLGRPLARMWRIAITRRTAPIAIFAASAGGPAFDLVVSKLRRPLVRPGTVRRRLLIERLARGDPRPIVSVVAPAGYGKTTLLSQWAARNGQAFAWVSVDEPDNDPKVLLT